MLMSAACTLATGLLLVKKKNWEREKTEGEGRKGERNREIDGKRHLCVCVCPCSEVKQTSSYISLMQVPLSLSLSPCVIKREREGNRECI